MSLRTRRTGLLPLAPPLALMPLVLLALASPQETGPKQGGGRPIVLGSSCVTSECHTGYNAGKFVHGPVALNLCDACHVMLEEGEHKFKMMKDVPDLCMFCHDTMPVRQHDHEPVAAGMCQACHDPHRSEFPFLLTADPSGPLCFSCHEQLDFDSHEYVHAPVVAGECLQCHEAHTSNHRMMLNREGNELCFYCHTESRAVLSQQEYWHAPVVDNCVLCHDPHSADYAKQLRGDIPGLCWQCHDDVRKQIGDASKIHSAVSMDDKCMNCHDPHASSHARVLKESLLDTCLGCHDKEIEVPGGRPLVNMKAELDAAEFLHGPIVQGNCVACHLPHAGSNFRRLIEEFPADFYAPFDLGLYALCFGCHDSDLVMQEQDNGLTRFRNGNRNLHFVHVNKEKKGRTCRACHAIHGSDRPFHVRESVPFGGWEIPINFERLEDGGTCLPGCHQEREYHRGPG